jgi:hypothetical protein
MRPLSETLNQLIAVAEIAIVRPQTRELHTAAAIFAEIRLADARPAEGIRTTRAALVMVILLEEFLAGDREPTSHHLMLAGAALPWLRGEAWRAVQNEKEARETLR